MSAARQRHKRARVPLVLRTHRPPPNQQQPTLPRHVLISTFHSLLRRKQQLQTILSSTTTTTTAAASELAAVEKELEGLGGLEWYQQLSVKGERRGGGGGGVGFTTAKWVMERLSGKDEWREALAEVRASKRRKRQRKDNAAASTEPSINRAAASEGRIQREEGDEQDAEDLTAVVSPTKPPPTSSHRRPRLLDVGSLSNPYQPYSQLLDLLAIDLNPQHPSVQRMDFFALSPTVHTRSFDAIVLSLVLNFVPSPVLRGRMLRRSARMLRVGGWLYCVLPAACVSNSRWLDEAVVRDVWRRCGLRVSEVHYSSKLVLIEAAVDASGEDGGEWKASMARHGAQHNNFSIALEAAGSDTGECTTDLPSDEEEQEG